MLQAPTGDFTVSDVFTLNNFGEIDLAGGTTPLRQPTDVARPEDGRAQAVADDNAARAVTLDDGSSDELPVLRQRGQPLPWITRDTRSGSARSRRFTKPVVLDYRNDLWKLQPTSRLTPADAATVQPATFPNTRTAAPEHVDGDLKIASFNVLNYFNETGEAYQAEGGQLQQLQGPHRRARHRGRLRAPTAAARRGRGRGPAASAGQGGPGDQLPRRRRLSLEEIENSAKYDGRRTATSPWPRWSTR